MIRKRRSRIQAVSLNDFEEEEDLEEEASPFPHPPEPKGTTRERKRRRRNIMTPMTTFKIKTLGSDDATAANDDGLTSEERGGVSAKTNVARW